MKSLVRPHAVFFLHGLLWTATLTVHRVLFIAFNHAYLDPSTVDFIQAFRFDVSWVGYVCFGLYLPFLGLTTIGSNSKRNVLLFGLFLLPCLVQTLTECWDLVYFRYTLKRSSFDLYSFFLSGPEQFQFSNLLTKFWWVALLALSVLSGYAILSFKILQRKSQKQTLQGKHIPMYLTCLFLFFLIARSSLGPKPLGILDASKFSSTENVQLVLNSPFVVLKTIQNDAIPDHEYMSVEKEKETFNPILTANAKGEEWKPNLVFIILESFGHTQIHQKTKGKSITPFTDSILEQSLYFTHAYAEGKTSVEALPALFAGIPSYLDLPFVISNYSTNKIDGFPTLCKNKGYQTSFFHGARKGSMRFDSFTKSLGFEQFYSMEDDPTPEHFDGAWGIYDHHFLNLMKTELNQMKSPFLATFFSLSSHEPYRVPKNHNFLPKGSTEIQQSYRYTDESLKRFFKSIAHSPWFKNTLFILTADHTPVQLDSEAKNIQEKYQIPIAIYAPYLIKPKKSHTPLSHVDLVPTLCEIMQWNQRLYSFGLPASKKEVQPDEIRYLNGHYSLWNGKYEIQFNEPNQKWEVKFNESYLTKHPNKSALAHALAQSKKRMLARIQRLRRDLRWNTLHK